MKHVIRILFIAFIALSTLTVKQDARAEVYFNTTGEKTPQGKDYVAKYWDGISWHYCAVGYNQIPNLIDVTYKVKYCYEEAYKMIDLVNAERRKAGVPELVVKDELMDVAMMRAAETAIYWDHSRPNGYGSETASIFIDGENLGNGSPTAQGANEGLVNSPGHHQTMISKDYAYAGYGCVQKYENGRCVGNYWVQIFSRANKYYENGYDRAHPENNKPVQWDTMTVGQRKDYVADFTAKVYSKILSIQAQPDYYDEEYVFVGDVPIKVSTLMYRVGASSYKSGYYGGVELSSDQYDVEVLTPSTCSYVNGKVKALAAGKAKLKCSLKADSSISTTVEFEIKDKPVPVKKGDSCSVSGNTYQVTDSGKRTVSYRPDSRQKKTVKIPEKVTIQGKTYKVTAIAANAFKGNTKVTSITIPSTVTSIGKNAFNGCKNLKKITIKSTKLTSVGKNALKGIHKKAVIKVPKSKVTKYKKLLKSKGQKKTVKIQK